MVKDCDLFEKKPFFGVGMFLRSHRRVREAAEQLVAAARLAPTEGARAAAAARALRDARRCRSAERWYAKAVQLKPEVRSHRHGLYILLVPLKKSSQRIAPECTS